MFTKEAVALPAATGDLPGTGNTPPVGTCLLLGPVTKVSE